MRRSASARVRAVARSFIECGCSGLRVFCVRGAVRRSATEATRHKAQPTTFSSVFRSIDSRLPLRIDSSNALRASLATGAPAAPVAACGTSGESSSGGGGGGSSTMDICIASGGIGKLASCASPDTVGNGKDADSSGSGGGGSGGSEPASISNSNGGGGGGNGADSSGASDTAGSPRRGGNGSAFRSAPPNGPVGMASDDGGGGGGSGGSDSGGGDEERDSKSAAGKGSACVFGTKAAPSMTGGGGK